MGPAYQAETRTREARPSDAGRDRHLVRGRFRARPSRRKRPVGADIDSLSMPWPEAGKMTDSEIHAVWLFLKSVPPKPFGGR